VSSASKSHEKETVIMRAARVTVAVTFCFAGIGCSASGGSETSGDCQAQLRADGTVYTSYGYTERSATKFSSADEADCEDVGEDAAGSVFPEHPRQVTTWVFPGYPPEEVLGVRLDQDSFAVFVADSVSPEERDRIYEDLASRTPRR
jgi:hypothetical protein